MKDIFAGIMLIALGYGFYVSCRSTWRMDLGVVMTQLSSAEKTREYYRRQGEVRERERIIALLKEQHVLRNCGATGLLVFVDCTNFEVLYLKDDLLNEVAA